MTWVWMPRRLWKAWRMSCRTTCGDKPAEIMDVRESHTQLAFRVVAIWE
jgi:hypothetical protein